jgi:hypothetical protein
MSLESNFRCDLKQVEAHSAQAELGDPGGLFCRGLGCCLTQFRATQMLHNEIVRTLVLIEERPRFLRTSMAGWDFW